MKRKQADGDDGRALGRVEEIVDELLRRGAAGSIIIMGSAMQQLREALDAAARENSWNLVEFAFSRATSLGAELLVRAQLEMREHLRRHDETGGAARRYPDIASSAERLERVVDWLLDVAVRYGRVRHLVDIARRRLDDPKIVPIEREAAAPAKRADARKKKAGGRA